MENQTKWQFSLAREAGIDTALLEQYAQALRAADDEVDKVPAGLAHDYDNKVLASVNARILVGSYVYFTERMVDPLPYERLDAENPADVDAFALEQQNEHLDRALVETYGVARHGVWQKIREFSKLHRANKINLQQELVFYQKMLAKEVAKWENAPQIAGDSLGRQMGRSLAGRRYQRAVMGLGAVEDLVRQFENNFQEDYECSKLDYYLPNVAIATDPSSNRGKAISRMLHEPDLEPM